MLALACAIQQHPSADQIDVPRYALGEFMDRSYRTWRKPWIALPTGAPETVLDVHPGLVLFHAPEFADDGALAQAPRQTGRSGHENLQQRILARRTQPGQRRDPGDA